MWRSDLVAIDGFDADFTGWGREDSDLFVRLIRSGVRRKDGRWATGVLHLWHPEADRGRLSENDAGLMKFWRAIAFGRREDLSALSGSRARRSCSEWQALSRPDHVEHGVFGNRGAAERLGAEMLDAKLLDLQSGGLQPFDKIALPYWRT